MRWGKDSNKVAPAPPGVAEPSPLHEELSAATRTAAKHVKQLLDLSEDRTTAPVLPRVEAKLAMVVTYHRVVTDKDSGKKATKVSRHMGYIVDNAPHTGFLKRVAEALHMSEKEAANLIITYETTKGVTLPIDSTATLRAWLDEWWACHPLQVHAFDPSLATDHADRSEMIRDLFARYDSDGSGVLNADEWRQMLRELCESSDFKPEDMDLEKWPVDVQKWAKFEFLKADVNGDGVVSLLEFTKYYHTMHEFLRHRLSRTAKANTIGKQLAEAFIEARSFRRPLAAILSSLGGSLLLDAYGHDHGIELFFEPAKCAAADPQRWVRAQTLISFKVDHITDPTNTIGDIRFSPIVLVEFEAAADGAAPTAPYTLTMPHCFDLEDLEMEDIVVVMCGLKENEWTIVEPSCIKLINPADGLQSCFLQPLNAQRPALEVSIPAGNGSAIFTVYGKALLHGHTIGQRVVCLAFTPEKIMPIELENMNLHFVPDLPEQFDIAYQAEQQERGLVAFGGRSRVFRVELPHSRIHVHIDEGGGMGHYLTWNGTHEVMTFEFDPENFLEAPPPAIDENADAVAQFALSGVSLEASAAEKQRLEVERERAKEAREEWRARADEMLVTEGGRLKYMEMLEAELLKLSHQRHAAEEHMTKAKKQRIAEARARGLLLAQERDEREAQERENGGPTAESSRDERRHLTHDTRGCIAMHLFVHDGPEKWHMGKQQRERRLKHNGEDPLAFGKLHSKMAMHQSASPHSHSFSVDVLIHGFLPPTEPMNVTAAHRTNTYLVIEWGHPRKWGGCSIDRYEIQLIEISVTDLAEAAKKMSEETGKTTSAANLSTTQAFASETFKKKEWKTVYEEMPLETGHNPTARIPIQLFAGRVRVRAFNSGCATPSRWSDVLHIGTVEEEKAALELESAARGLHARKELKAMREVPNEGQGAANLTKALSAGAGAADGGNALVEHGDVTEGVGDKVVKSMRGWPAHKKQLGRLWLELGVPGGLNGRLMDLTLPQVDALVEGQGHDADGLNEDKPLISLARCACWVMETLAHHTADPEEWIDFMNEVEGLVSLAVHQRVGFDEATTPLVRKIIHTLHEIFETMRQCEPEGYITRVLSARYTKATKRHLRAVWKRRLHGLKEDLATSVNSMILHNRQQGIEQMALLGSTAATRTLYHLSGEAGASGSNTALDVAASAASKGFGAMGDSVVITRISANGIVGGSTPDTTLKFTLLKAGVAAQTTRAGADSVLKENTQVVEATWNDDIVTLPLASSGERGMRLKVQLWGGATGQTLLGTNTIELLGACGRVDNLRIFSDGDEEGAQEATQVEMSLEDLTLLPMVNFSFRVTPWLKDDLIQPNIKAVQSESATKQQQLFTSNRMWWAWGQTRLSDELRIADNDASEDGAMAEAGEGVRASSSLKQTWKAVGKHAEQSVWKKPKAALLALRFGSIREI